MPKNIVVFSDGTGQEGGTGSNTNVYKTFQMIESRSDRQISFYDRGLGTGSRKLISSATGRGISKNIMEGYRFIFDNYAVGDRIFLFGFSRGAATVRSLAGFLDLFGVLPDSRPELIDRAYAIYQGNDESARLRKADAFVQNNGSLWCDVHFIGVWDTVSALGVPWAPLSVLLDKLPVARHKFHDFTLSKRVRHARHALAIDDERDSFHPTLWREDGLEPHQTLKQVWFAGMHTDVGGGYPEHELSDIPFDWMMREAIEQGLLIHPMHEVESRPSHVGLMHDSRQPGLKKLFRKEVRTWPPRDWARRADSREVGRPTVHESVRLRAAEVDSYTPWILGLDCADEPWRNDVEELTETLEELARTLGSLAPETSADVRQKEVARLGELADALDLSLRIAHALAPRGRPEKRKGDHARGGLTLEEKKARRRKRGEYRGELFARSAELLASFRRVPALLAAGDQAWDVIESARADAQGKAERFYELYVHLWVEEALRR